MREDGVIGAPEEVLVDVREVRRRSGRSRPAAEALIPRPEFSDEPREPVERWSCISPPAKDGPGDVAHRILIYHWWRRDPKAMVAMVVTANLFYGMIIWVIFGGAHLNETFVFRSIPPLVVGDAGLAIGLFLTRDWWTNWSLRVLLDGERARSVIGRMLTANGIVWKEVALIETPRYFRRFSGPIELLRPGTRIWTRTESFRGRRAGPIGHITIVILEPGNKKDDLEALRSGLFEALKDEAERQLTGGGRANPPAAGREA